MGYKAWIGGKSKWVSTKFGTARAEQSIETSGGPGASYDVTSERKYLFEMPNGTIREIKATTVEGAKMLAGEGAKLISKKSRKKRGD